MKELIAEAKMETQKQQQLKKKILDWTIWDKHVSELNRNEKVKVNLFK